MGSRMSHEKKPKTENKYDKTKHVDNNKNIVEQSTAADEKEDVKNEQDSGAKNQNNEIKSNSSTDNEGSKDNEVTADDIQVVEEEPKNIEGILSEKKHVCNHVPNIDDKLGNATFLDQDDEDKHKEEFKTNKEDNYSEKGKEEKESEEESVKNENDETGKQKETVKSTGVQVSDVKPKEKKTVSWSDTVTVKTDDGTISKKQPITCDACTAISTEFIQKNIFKDDSDKNEGKSDSSKDKESDNEQQETSGKSLAHTCDSFDLARSRIPLKKDKDDEKEDKE